MRLMQSNAHRSDRRGRSAEPALANCPGEPLKDRMREKFRGGVAGRELGLLIEVPVVERGQDLVQCRAGKADVHDDTILIQPRASELYVHDVRGAVEPLRG